jgi:anaerobic dimethyl sulfoxide reductase subunit C (anchor subunit)
MMRTLGSSKFGKEEIDQVIKNPLLIIYATITVAIIGSHFHLSRPWYSFLAMLNIKYSWLSREILFTIVYYFFTGYLVDLVWFSSGRRISKTIIGWVAILFGLTTIFCMARIYLLPSQVAWNSPFTLMSFYSSAFLLGVMSTAAILLIDLNFAEVRKLEDVPVRAEILQKSLGWLALSAVFALIFIMFINLYQIEFLRAGDSSAQASLALLLGIYQPLFILRAGLLLVGVGWLVVTVIGINKLNKSIREYLSPIFISCMLVMIGEILGRFLFYATHVRIGI